MVGHNFPYLSDQNGLHGIWNDNISKPNSCPDRVHYADDDVAFLDFLNEVVLNSFDGCEGQSTNSHLILPADFGSLDSTVAKAMAQAADKQQNAKPGAATNHKKRGRGGVDDDDTVSIDTMPMPNRCGARAAAAAAEAEEVTSASGVINDLVAVPHNRSKPKRQRQASDADATNNTHSGKAEGNAAAAAEAEGVFKAVLVAKALTKSDASSKRIILPRIAIEANLPELTAPASGGAHGQGRALHFDALDRSGRTWPLSIKAWANGANPKPVYVLEGRVGELMKGERLGPGDVVGVLASQDGRYFVHWNTEQVRQAAARPTFCKFEFAEHDKSKQEQQQQVADAQQKPSTEAAATVGVAAAHNPSAPGNQPPPKQDSEQQQEPEGPTAAQPQKEEEVAAAKPPRVAAMPVMRSPVVPGLFTPTSPCEMLVMGAAAARKAAVTASGAAAPYNLAGRCSGLVEFDSEVAATLMSLDDVTAESVAASDAAAEAAAAVAKAAAAAAAAAAPASAEEVPAGRAAPAPGEVEAAQRVGGIVHHAGHLLCPRTEGCTRPAGHQGWCVGRRMPKKK